MAKVFISKSADRDLENILCYSIEKFGDRIADEYQSQLRAALLRVGEDPRLGTAIPGRTRVFYKYNCKRHGVFYYKTARGITIARILHLSMNFVRHLPKS